MEKERLKENFLKNVKVNSGLLARKNELIRKEVIPYQWKALNDEISDAEPSKAIENFRIAAGKSEGEYYGMVFQDSDVAKWLEAVAYQLVTNPDKELEELADSVIDLIGKAQQPDGYLNTYFTIAEPGKRWTNLAECHELYCAGHMLEAAVAYYQATGKKKLLDIMIRFVDHIDEKFGPEEGKLK
ncbi:MAG TPA: beta-L-arabinofuranosidase domain-containing protein, partial [Halanaerobiales bacterium]|nr:beta-L-arabinofuranosidase domain-containing protein [Halanaerobiales bacterium]